MPVVGWASTRVSASDNRRASRGSDLGAVTTTRHINIYQRPPECCCGRLRHGALPSVRASSPTSPTTTGLRVGRYQSFDTAASVLQGKGVSSTRLQRSPRSAPARPPAWQHRPLAEPAVCRSSAPATPGGPGAGSAFGDPNTLVGMLMAYAVQLQQQQQQQAAPRGAEIQVEGIGFHPPGTEKPLLEDINIVLPANSLGLVMGRSGSGKTTLLQVLAGLTEQTSGHVRILHGASGQGAAFTGLAAPSLASQYAANGNGNGNGNGKGNGGGAGAAAAGRRPAAPGLTVEERMQQVGLVFQFPERHFLGEDLMQELTFTWPRLPQYWGERQALSAKMQQVLEGVGLEDIPLHVPPWTLSGGQQRRLALAIQLVRQPALLLLDEPLAGLDWIARQEVVTILRKLKEQCTLLVVSHDLAEIAPLVDCAWRMRIGGTCEPVAWPPSDLAGLE